MSYFNIIEFTLLTGIAYIVTRFLLANTKYYNMKRAYILSVIPFLFILTFSSFGIVSSPIVKVNPFVEEILVQPSNQVIATESIAWIWIVYITGIAVSISIKLMDIIKVNRIISNSSLIDKKNGIKIYENTDGLSFCFFKRITVAKTKNQSILIEHELKHIAHNHHIDLLLSNLYHIVFWFNPFTYLMTKELQATHEFQVDSNAEYNLSDIIPTMAKKKNVIAITSNHNFINYKRRIEMKTSNRKYIPSLIAGVMLTLFTIGISAVTSHSVSADEITSTDKVPTYKGNMMTELSNEIKYPKLAYENKVEGKVIVKVKIDKDGNQIKTEVDSSSGNAALDNEAIRAVKTLEDWEAGTVGGKSVAAWLQIPIKFKLP